MDTRLSFGASSCSDRLITRCTPCVESETHPQPHRRPGGLDARRQRTGVRGRLRPGQPPGHGPERGSDGELDHLPDQRRAHLARPAARRLERRSPAGGDLPLGRDDPAELLRAHLPRRPHLHGPDRGHRLHAGRSQLDGRREPRLGGRPAELATGARDGLDEQPATSREPASPGVP